MNPVKYTPDEVEWRYPQIVIKARRPPDNIPDPQQHDIHEGDIWVDADNNVWVYTSDTWRVMSTGQVHPGTNP